MYSNKNKIFYIGSFKLPDLSASANRVLAISELLVTEEYNIEILSYSKQDQYFADRSRELANVYGDRIKFYHLSKVEILKRIIGEVKANKAVNVICYNLSSDLFCLLLALSKFLSIYLISDVTEWYSADISNPFKNALKWIDTTLRMKVLNKMTPSRIVVSKFLYDYYTQKKQKTTIRIPTLLPKIGYTNIVSETSIRSVDLKNNKLVLFYAGSPFRYTGKEINVKKVKERIDLLVEVVGELKITNIELRIFGISKQEYLISFPHQLELINKNEHKFLFGGKVSRDRIAEEIKVADFMVILRDQNLTNSAGFPTKFTESMLNGLPVILTKATDVSDFFVENKNGFYVNLNKEDLKKKILTLSSLDRETINNMKDSCLQNKILKNYTFLSELKKI